MSRHSNSNPAATIMLRMPKRAVDIPGHEGRSAVGRRVDREERGPDQARLPVTEWAVSGVAGRIEIGVL